MAQVETSGWNENDEGIQSSPLEELLSKFNVSDAIYEMVKKENLTIDELVTFTSDELKDLCNENKIKTSDKRRFINAIKSIPNSESSKPKPKEIIKKIYLSNEEKEEINNFDIMKNNINNLSKLFKTNINESDLNNKNIKNEINAIYDQIISYIDGLRDKLIKQVKS